jgi:hypothetical protein
MTPGRRGDAGISRLGILALVLGVVTFAAFITTILVTIAIWPGEAKLTAPLFCPDDKSDAFVVVDQYSPEPGRTSYNFSLYCMGSRGQTTEIGFLRPSLVLMAAHGALIALVVAALLIPIRRRRRGRRSPVVDAPAAVP